MHFDSLQLDTLLGHCTSLVAVHFASRAFSTFCIICLLRTMTNVSARMTGMIVWPSIIMSLAEVAPLWTLVQIKLSSSLSCEPKSGFKSKERVPSRSCVSHLSLSESSVSICRRSWLQWKPSTMTSYVSFLFVSCKIEPTLDELARGQHRSRRRGSEEGVPEAGHEGSSCTEVRSHSPSSLAPLSSTIPTRIHPRTRRRSSKRLGVCREPAMTLTW
jgi:hypothetical protein